MNVAVPATSPKPHFSHVAIIGVGLIGGSFALALKAAGVCDTVVGVGRDRANLDVALSRGIIDRVASSIEEAVAQAELVLVATPVAQFAHVFSSIARALSPQTLVTDAGSTKRDVVRAARHAFGARIGRFIPSHPIAGAEHSGAAAARADLYVSRRVVVSALEENAAVDVARIEAACRVCGARIGHMSAEEHDAVFAAVSHLPHVLAFGLVEEFSTRADAARLFGYAAGGFRDFTRIASSHPEMWRDICLANRDAISAELTRYGQTVAELQALVAAGDGAALEARFHAAREARNRWLAGDFDASTD